MDKYLFSDLRPLETFLEVFLDDDLVFHGTPSRLHDVWVQVVVPSVINIIDHIS